MEKNLIEEIYLKINNDMKELKNADEKVEQKVKEIVEKVNLNEITLETLEEMFMDASTVSLKEGFIVGYKFGLQLLLKSIMRN